MLHRLFKSKSKKSEHVYIGLLPRLFIVDAEASSWHVTVETVVHREIDEWLTRKEIPFRKVILQTVPYTVYLVEASRNKMKALSEEPGVIQIYEHLMLIPPEPQSKGCKLMKESQDTKE
jgi:hypothetical protein